MNLLHLQYFHEVARTRSFTETSRNLRVSQPAVSKMVRLLENDVGQVLLERTRRGVSLTPAGEDLFQSASRIFSEAREARARLQGAPKQFRGEWSLGVSDNIALYVVPRVLGGMKAANPNLRINLFAGTSSQIKQELHYDRCRLGIFYTPLGRGEPFESREVARTEFWIVIGARHPWVKKQGRRRLTLAGLKQAGIRRLESRHRDYSGGFPAHFHSNRLGFTDAPWIEVNQHEVKKRFVLEGYGFSLLTRHTVEAEVKAGLLRRVEVPRKLDSPIYAVWRKGAQLDAVSMSFLDRLERHARETGVLSAAAVSSNSAG